VKAFATYVVGKVTRTGAGNLKGIVKGALLDEDDDLPALLARGRSLPGRTVTVRTADDVTMSRRLTSPGVVLRVMDDIDETETDDEEDVRAAG
jgi:hypothetical protein